MNCDSETEDNNQSSRLFDNTADRKLFKELITQLNDFLKKKRRPFLREQAEVMVTQYKNDDVFLNLVQRIGIKLECKDWKTL